MWRCFSTIMGSKTKKPLKLGNLIGGEKTIGSKDLTLRGLGFKIQSF